MTEEDEAFNDIERQAKQRKESVRAALQYPQKDIDWQREQQIKAQVSTPQQRAWVGLTDEELIQLSNKWRIVYGGHVGDFVYEIEAKLKEKNT